MWKAAFPNASTTAEKDETNWVKKTFDLSGPTETIRLAGTWLPVPIARQLGAEYKLTSLSPPLSLSHPGLTSLSPIAPETVEGLSKAEPDYDTVLRSHENGTQDTPNVPPSKRRKAASPRSPEKKPIPSSGRTTRSSVDTPAATASPRVSIGRQLRSKTKSPAPATRGTPSRAVKSKIMTPPAEKDDPLVTAAESELPDVSPDADIAESKALVDQIKAELNAPGSKTTTPTKSLPKRGAAAKRARDDAEDILPNGKPLIKMDLDVEPADPNVDREIASNKRIVKWRQSLPSFPTLPQLEPKQKSAAWGTLAFALAIGAT
jgi:hypothetical protein